MLRCSPRHDRGRAGMWAVQVEGLPKYYAGLAAVDGVDFAIEAGEVVAVLGPIGAGKTTTVEPAVRDHSPTEIET